MATKTFTFPASQVYVSKGNLRHTINKDHTFTMDMTDDGTTARYTLLAGSTIACSDGFRFKPYGNPAFSFMNITSNAAAVLNPGSLWFYEDDGELVEIKIKSATIDDADAPTSATIIFERVDDPSLSFTWTSLTVA